jgi:hypothetical protein
MTCDPEKNKILKDIPGELFLILKKTGQHWFKLQRESDGSWDFQTVFFLLENFAIVAIFLKVNAKGTKEYKGVFRKICTKVTMF